MADRSRLTMSEQVNVSLTLEPIGKTETAIIIDDGHSQSSITLNLKDLKHFKWMVSTAVTHIEEQE